MEADIAAGRWDLGRAESAGGTCMRTRFPPEPNGYLHVGHAKSICLNYALAMKYGGRFNLRFDDTNPAKEEQEYVDSIVRDMRWLTSAFGGSFDSGPHAGGLYFASDYFGFMYACACDLIGKGLAYVCELSAAEVGERRGSVGVPATSPFRDRPPAESLKLFDEMRRGEHADGRMTLRARIDLESPNFNLRDPVMYRIVREHHHNTGGAWCIYPMYDWAHGLEDSLERVTHSVCTLEFENHRPLYDWFVRAVNQGRRAGVLRTSEGGALADRSGQSAAPTSTGADWPPSAEVWHSQQIEFAKLQLTYTVLSKRNMLKMVSSGIVRGWDDPRMPTLSGMRRRGYTPGAIRALCEDVGVTKVDSVIDLVRLENALRDDLNRAAPRAMGVLRPLELLVENWPVSPDGKPVVDMLDFVVNPERPGAGTRKVPFDGRLLIERDDFMETAGADFFRLAIGQEVRLRWAYFVTPTRVDKDASGAVTRVICTYDPATRGGDAPHGPDGKPVRKVRGTVHWISAAHGVPAEVRLYERLFAAEFPGQATGNWMDDLAPSSLEVVSAVVEPLLTQGEVGATFQLERLGYFCVDPDSGPARDVAARKLVLNRAVTLKDGAKGAAGALASTKPASGAGPSGKTYSFGQTAHTLKLSKERLGEVLVSLGMAAAPEKLTQAEFDKVRKHVTGR